jgi:histidinol-phosphate aminotransferase
MTEEGPESRRPVVPPIEHGGPDLEELSRLVLDRAQILDFSVCTNPFGPSPHVAQSLAQVRLDEYPDREARGLRDALAEIHSVDTRHILAGNGVSELIWLTAMAFVRPEDRVLVIGPTYGEYARSALLQGGVVSTWTAREETHFAIVPREIETELDHCRPRLVFLCNPNNPTGTAIPPRVISTWTKLHPRTLFVVDEAYQSFAPGLPSLIPDRAGNLLILRSMTKDYALAGLRLGYAVGAEDVIAALRQVQPPWSVSAMAQAAGVAALGDEHHLAQSLEDLARAKRDLVKSLTELGLAVWPSAAHFFLARVGDGAAFRQTLLQRGMLVRDAASFGLPAFVRLGTRRAEENARLLSALREVSWQPAS